MDFVLLSFNMEMDGGTLEICTINNHSLLYISVSPYGIDVELFYWDFIKKIRWL